MPRRKLILAVFGSNQSQTLEPATQLGSEIARKGHILLTGGAGDIVAPPTRTAVKDAAIHGADGSHGHWIGVGRSGTIQLKFERGSNAVVIDTSLGHGRNALEACLCDAAIALEGGLGTASEAVCCLSLGKPVVFIGDGWTEYGLDESAPIDFSRLVAARTQRIGTIPTTAAPLDLLFDESRMLHTLTTPPQFDWQPSSALADPTALSAAIDWLSVRFNLSAMGHFPNMSQYELVRARFNRWIARL